jgi:excisionase family DNA binding protein
MNGVGKLEVVAALLNYAETSQLLGVKVNTLYAWVSRRVIPFVRLSPRVVRFRREEIEAWMDERSVHPVSSRVES